MAGNLRVEDFQAYRPFREVEPVLPTERVTPQRPRDEYPPEHREGREYHDERARRRFIAMRDLIGGLRESGRIVRVDYQTALAELTQQGVAIAESELSDCLRTLKVRPEGMEHLAQQLRQAASLPELEFGAQLDEMNNYFPVYIRGLLEFYLRFSRLELLPGEEGPLLVDAISSDGSYRYASKRLRLICRPQVKAQYDSALELDVRVLVGVGEVDEDNRRAVLYQRDEADYALYTDKQISLSI